LFYCCFVVQRYEIILEYPNFEETFFKKNLIPYYIGGTKKLP
jgi:hypothetical protein